MRYAVKSEPPESGFPWGKTNVGGLVFNGVGLANAEPAETVQSLIVTCMAAMRLL